MCILNSRCGVVFAVFMISKLHRTAPHAAYKITKPPHSAYTTRCGLKISAVFYAHL